MDLGPQARPHTVSSESSEESIVTQCVTLVRGPADGVDD